MKESNKIIHSLWIGKVLSNIELLTIKSFVANGHDFFLWVYDIIEAPIPEGVTIMDANTIIPSDKIFRYKNKNQFGHGKGSLGGFSDIFRYKLLYENGGWWVDMDVTCLKPLDFVEDYVFRKHHELDLVGNVMKCPKRSELMKLCYERAILEVDENNVDWHKPITILNDYVKLLGLSSKIKDFSNQDNWPEISKMLLKKNEIPDTWRAIHWANEEWRRNKIEKNFFMNKSTLGQLMNSHNIKSGKMSILKRINYSFKLSFSYQRIFSIPKKVFNFFKWHLEWHLNSGSKEQN